MNSPFKFLDAYTILDKDLFFGRDKEVDALYNMVFETPIILLYGLSGTGKTSLIKCGLASKFSGPDWNPYFIRRNKNINHSLAQIIKKETPNIKGDSVDLIARLKALYLEYFSPVYLIFDQFEELFILGTAKEQKEFIQTIKDILAADINCKIILSMREEYLGNLYEFEKEVPYLFDFKLRVERMNIDTVKSVLYSSFEKFKIEIEEPYEKNINQIIDNISQGKSGINLPYLQVYLDNLYKEDFARTFPGSTRQEGEFPPITFTAKEIYDFGDIDNVLEKFLIDQEQEIGQEFALKYPKLSASKIREIVTNFITEEGTKKPIRYEAKEGISTFEQEFRDEFPNLTDQELLEGLKALEIARIVRFTDDTIELAHDSLAAVIHKIRDHEDLKLREVKNQLKVHYKTYLETNAFLNHNKLVFYDDYLPLLTLSPEILTFIEDSKKSVRKKNIINIAKTIGLSFFVISIFYIGILLYKINDHEAGAQSAQSAIQDLNTQIANILGLNKLTKKVAKSYEKINKDRTSAYLDSREVLNEAKNYEEGDLGEASILRKELLRNIDRYPFYKNKILIKDGIFKANTVTINDTVNLLFTLNSNALQLRVDTLNEHFSILGDSSIIFKNESEIVDYQIIKQENEIQIIYATKEGNIQLWSLNKQQLENEIHDFGTEIYCLTESANPGEYYVGTSKGIGVLSLSDFNRDPKILQQTEKPVTQIKASILTKLVIFKTTEEEEISILDRKKYYPQTGSFKINKIGFQEKNMTAFDVSEDGQLITIAYDNGQAGIWDLNKKIEVQRLIGQEAIIQSIALSPNKEFVITGGFDGKAVVWNRKGEIIRKLVGHENALSAVSFINNSLVSTTEGADDLKIWDISSLAEQQFTFTNSVNQLAFSSNGKKLALSCHRQLGTFNLIDLDNEQINLVSQAIQTNENQGFIQDLIFLDSTQVLLGASNHLTSIIDTKTKFQLDLRRQGNMPSTTLISCLATKNDLVAVGENNRKMILLRNIDSLEWHNILFYPSKIYALEFDTKEPYLFAGYDDGAIIQWNTETGLPIDTLYAHTNRVKTLKLFTSDDQAYLLSGSTDNKAILWKKNEADKYQAIQTLKGHLGDVNAVDFSSSSNLALTASGDKTVKLWEMQEGKLTEQSSFIRHLGSINTAAFSPDGSRIATGSDDKTLKIWNIQQIDAIIENRIIIEGE